MKKCELCASSRYQKIYSFPEGDIYLCQKCGLGFFHGAPFEDKYQEYKEGKSLRFAKRFFLYLEFGNLKKKKELKILEIGSGSGELAYYLSSAGHKVTCCDISEKSLNLIRQKYHLKTICGKIEDISLPENYFDIILMRHVIEHLDEPIYCIKKLYTALKKDGSLYITTPNYDSWARRIARKKWNWCIPDHRYFWSTRTLARFLYKQGFQIVRIKHIFTHNGISRALDNLCPLPLKHLTRPLTFTLGLTLELLSIACYKGQNLFIEARK